MQPMPRRRPDLATGVEQDVPYDQTQLAGADTPQMADPSQSMGAPVDPAAQAPDAGGMDLGGLGDPTMPGGVDAQPAPEDLQVQQMAQALDDPNTPPQEKIAIQQQLALAARRQLAGMGG